MPRLQFVELLLTCRLCAPPALPLSLPLCCPVAPTPYHPRRANDRLRAALVAAESARDQLAAARSGEGRALSSELSAAAERMGALQQQVAKLQLALDEEAARGQVRKDRE